MRRRSGFATIVALTFLMLVGTTLLVLATSFTGDARRTTAATADAQNRQLLIAAALAAQAKADELAAGKEVKVELPAQLATEGAKVSCKGKAQELHVETEYLGHRASQVLTLTRQGQQWRVTGARLGE